MHRFKGLLIKVTAVKKQDLQESGLALGWPSWKAGGCKALIWVLWPSLNVKKLTLGHGFDLLLYLMTVQRFSTAG